MLQTAVLAVRVENGDPDTAEIRRLTEAAGARVVGEVVQKRPKDPGTVLGAGAIDRIAAQVSEYGADTVVVDEPLTPQQTVTLEEHTSARVIDRHRLVLEIFARQARSRRAQLQVELARLRYRLPRLRERADEGALNRRTEKGTRYYDVADRIDELERKLQSLPPVEQRFEQRREQEFDLVAIAGYTNAGKSTLLRQLADEMSVEDRSHEDIEQSVTAADQLFETLETTTRCGTIEGREILFTDTVGFLDDLPHWLVESFRGTLSAVEHADTVLLVVDGDQPGEELCRKVETVLETFGEQHPQIVPVLNKADRFPERHRDQRQRVLGELLDDHGIESVPPVAISAKTGFGLAPLKETVQSALPGLRYEEFVVPLTDQGLSVLSQLYDEAVEIAVEYGSDSVTVEFAARAATVAKMADRVDSLSVADSQ